MFFRRSNQPNRITKTYDEVYSDQAGAATDWLPYSLGDAIVVTINKASLQAVQSPPGVVQQYQINASQGFPNATVVLEAKLGGQADSEAKPITSWSLTSVHYRGSPGGYGFARLRIATINTSTDPEGVVLSMTVDKTIRPPT